LRRQGYFGTGSQPSRPALSALEYTFQWRRDDTRPLLAHMRAVVVQTVDFPKPSPL
jgi:hypothetical protein